jgi:hypothetical protein
LPFKSYTKIFLLFVATVKSVISLISFSAHLSFVQRWSTDFFFLVNFISNPIAEGVYQL